MFTKLTKEAKLQAFERIDAIMEKEVEAIPEDFEAADVEKFNVKLRNLLDAENLSLEDYHSMLAEKFVDEETD
jgi:hypothetical protein